MKVGFSFSLFYIEGKSQLEKQDCFGLFCAILNFNKFDNQKTIYKIMTMT